MNYLTNYYKNKAEQLQQKINMLQIQLNESAIAMPEPASGNLVSAAQTTPGNGFGGGGGQGGFGSGQDSPFKPKEGDKWTSSDGTKYRIRNGQLEFYWIGKTGEGWLPVSDKNW